MKFFQELKRRNVFRVGIAYAILAWLLLQVTDVVVPILELPAWVPKLVLFLLLAGLPLVLLFAWAYELTPEGLKREKDVAADESIARTTGRKLDRAIIAILAVAVVVLLADRFWFEAPAESAREAPVAAAQADDTGAPASSVAVLPFLALSSGPDDEYFADGLTEEILNSLAQLPELLVTARTSAFAFKGKELPIAEIAASLGVRHVVEGSVRRSGDRLRVTAQLIRAEDGFHLWSQNYDRDAEDTFAVQENIAESIATSLDVVLDDTRREAMRRAGLKDVTAFVAYQKGMAAFQAAHLESDLIEQLPVANRWFEQVIERVPDYGPAYMLHSDLYVHRLVDDAANRVETRLAPAEIDELIQKMRDDYALAIRHARTAEQRHAWELDLAALTGEWQGLPGRIEAVLDDSGCVTGNWLPGVASEFGYAARTLDRMRDLLACDPLFAPAWVEATALAVDAGEPETGLQLARQGRETTGENFTASMVIALAAVGDFAAAEEIAKTELRNNDSKLTALGTLAALRGDAAETARLFDAYRQDADADAFGTVSFQLRLGQREAVNRYAAELDLHPFGYVALLMWTSYCECGSPFELAAVPDFAARIEAAGLPWNPPSPLGYPLKDW